MPTGVYAPNLSSGNGVATVFPYNFRILAATHLTAVVNGVTLTLGVGYTVDGVGNVSGGNVTFTTAPANGVSVLRYRDVPYVRTEDYQYNGDLREDVVDADFDNREMQIQQIAETLVRALTVPIGTSGFSGVLPTPVGAGGRVLSVKAAENGIEFIGLAGIGSIAIPVPIAQGGTNATTAATALTALGALSQDADDITTVTPVSADLLLFGDASDGNLVRKATIAAVLALLGSSGLPTRYGYGLNLANGTDATNDIDIAVGGCRDTTAAFDLILLSATTKQLDATWVTGTNNGGRFDAAISDGTWFVFAVRESGGTVGVGFSKSLVPTAAPNYPASATYQLIGCILRESAAIVGFFNPPNTNEFIRKSPVLTINQTAPGTSAVTRTMAVPIGLRLPIKLNIYAQRDVGIAPVVWLSSLDCNDDAPSTTAAPLGQVGFTNTGSASDGVAVASDPVYCNTSGQIRSRVSVSGAASILRLVDKGWDDIARFKQ